MKPGPFEIMIGTAYNCDAKPGEGSVVHRWDSGLFKPAHVERVKGIDYSAFKIRDVLIGQRFQWQDAQSALWFAEDLFSFDAPMTTIQNGLDFSIHFINTSDKPKPFAVMLVGRLLR